MGRRSRGGLWYCGIANTPMNQLYSLLQSVKQRPVARGCQAAVLAPGTAKTGVTTDNRAAPQQRKKGAADDTTTTVGRRPTSSSNKTDKAWAAAAAAETNVNDRCETSLDIVGEKEVLPPFQRSRDFSTSLEAIDTGGGDCRKNSARKISKSEKMLKVTYPMPSNKRHATVTT